MPIDSSLPVAKPALLPLHLTTFMACMMIGCLPLIRVQDARWWYALIGGQILAFVLAGILQVVALKKKLEPNTSFTNKGIVKSIVLMFVAVLLGLAILYTVVNSRLLLLSLTGTAALVVPYATAFAYDVFATMPPPKQYPLWYKRDNLIDYKAFVFLASVSVKIKLRPLMLDTTYAVYTIVVPTQIELGKMFHFFLIQQQNNEVLIEVKDEFNGQVGWQFFIEKRWGYKLIPLNPDLNIWENQVKPNSTIVARRVVVPKATPSYHFQQAESHELYRHRG